MMKRALVAVEAALILPGALFMTALFARNLQPAQYEPAHTAQRIVDWYASRPGLALWGFLITLPLIVLIIGGVTLTSRWRSDDDVRRAARDLWIVVRAHAGTLVIAAATLAAGGILAIVALHVITD